MDIKFEKSDAVSAELTVSITKSDYAEKTEKALKEISHKAQMPGFRPGKVPMGLIKKMYGAQAKAEEVNKLIQDGLFNYIKEHKVNMLGEPLKSEKQAPQDLDEQDDFSFTFDIALAPEFTVELTEADKIDYYQIEADEASINTKLDELRNQNGRSIEVDTYADGDILHGTLRELTAEGSEKEDGLKVENASLMPKYFSDEEQKALFKEIAKGQILTFNPSKAHSANELPSLLKVSKEEAEKYTSDFSYEVTDIRRYVAAEVSQEFFDRIFGADVVKSEEECRAKLKEMLETSFAGNADFKFLIDARNYLLNKIGPLEFPDKLLKRIMKQRNADKDEKFIEENYERSIEELKWSLVKDQLALLLNLKIEEADMKAAASNTARMQMAQYGMSNIPQEYIEKYAEHLLEDEKSREMVLNRCIDMKLTTALKQRVTLNNKTISPEEFQKLV